MRTRYRVFLAINLPENIKEELTKYQLRCARTTSMRGEPHTTSIRGGSIKWVKKDNLHITLAFLGYLFDEKIIQIADIFKKNGLKQSPFSIELNKISYVPEFKKPKMVWVMIKKSEGLTNLRQNLDKILTELEIGLENRELNPHITLGRIRQWEFRRIELEDRPRINENISLNFSVNSIDLMESKLKRTGPQYILLASTPLEK